MCYVAPRAAAGMMFLPLLWLLVALLPPQLCRGQPCSPKRVPGAANVLMIGDSISMGCGGSSAGHQCHAYGYGSFVKNLLQTQSLPFNASLQSPGTLVGSVQHGEGMQYNFDSSKGAAQKVACSIGNATGQNGNASLPPNAWSVVTYNAGLHDCTRGEWVEPKQYAANLKAAFQTAAPAAATLIFVTTTPFGYNFTPKTGTLVARNGSPNISCVLQRNEIARRVAASAGAVLIGDLYAYVERFCSHFNRTIFPGYTDNYTTPEGVVAWNYTYCAIQHTGGLHFNTERPAPSGAQYTALEVARVVAEHLSPPALKSLPPNPASPRRSTALVAAARRRCTRACPTCWWLATRSRCRTRGTAVTSRISSSSPAAFTALAKPSSMPATPATRAASM
eukprot:SAG11_NODE_210_length_12303_cov_10.235824_7_plen_392_part_00